MVGFEVVVGFEVGVITYSLEFEIPGVPKATNSLLGGSKWTKHRNATDWKRRVGMVTLRYPKPKAPLEHCLIYLVRWSYRTLDYDGCVASFKPVVDGLVEVGILKSDTWKITGPWVVDQKYIPKGQEKIQVGIYEVVK